MKLKRWLLVLFVVLLIVIGCQGLNRSETMPEEVRAVWVSYIEYSSMLNGRDESSFRTEVQTMFENLKTLNFNTVYVHASAFTDAFYRSDFYPWSSYAAGTLGQDPGFDPLAIMAEEADRAGFQIEAWINPLRSFRSDQQEDIPADCVIGQWLRDPEIRGTWIVNVNDRWYLNPAYPQVRELIASVARELAGGYKIDGLHMDDYFYPEGVSEDFDATAYQQYLQEGGSMTLSQWRKDNVNQMVKAIYSAVKEQNPTLRVGISPAGNMEYAVQSIYGDVREWAQNEGYVDYLAPQIYFGYEHGTLPFDDCLNQWKELVQDTGTELIVGLAAYKINTEDHYAKQGRYEWQQNSDILSRQIDQIQQDDKVRGYAVFSYNSLFHPSEENARQVSQELQNLIELMGRP